MTIRNAWYLLIAFGIALSACVLEIVGDEELSDEPYDGVVAVQRAGLGSITTLLSVPATRVLHLTASQAVLARDTTTCNGSATLWRVLNNGATTTGTNCPARFLNGGGDGTAFVYSNVTRDIFRYDANALARVIRTPGVIVGAIGVDATHVYWSDYQGIKKAPRDGSGIVSFLNYDGAFDLLGVENGLVYFQKNIAYERFELWTMRTDGTNKRFRISESVRFKDFAVRNGVVHWVNNTALPHRITTYNINTYTYSDPISHNSDEFGHPTPAANGSLYFTQKSFAGFGSIKIRRKTNGQFFDEVTMIVEVLKMAVGSASLMWVEDWGASKRVKRAEF